jgi:hypothetical protein
MPLYLNSTCRWTEWNHRCWLRHGDLRTFRRCSRTARVIYFILIFAIFYLLNGFTLSGTDPPDSFNNSSKIIEDLSSLIHRNTEIIFNATDDEDLVKVLHNCDSYLKNQFQFLTLKSEIFRR